MERKSGAQKASELELLLRAIHALARDYVDSESADYRQGMLNCIGKTFDSNMMELFQTLILRPECIDCIELTDK
jgi:hypothetical protein